MICELIVQLNLNLKDVTNHERALYFKSIFLFCFFTLNIAFQHAGVTEGPVGELSVVASSSGKHKNIIN